MRVVFFGTPEFAVPALEAVAARFDVSLVVAQPDRPKGRGRALAQLVADVGQHHLRAFAHEQMRRRAAEAHQLALDRRRRAGQQCHLALQSHPGPPFRFRLNRNKANLILRGPRSGRLEGWERARSLVPILRDAPFGRSSG